MSLELRASVMTMMLGLVSGCASASNGEGAADPNSQQLIAISHRATTPNASLAILYDGTYRFLDEEARKETAGQLTAGELSKLEEHASEAAIQGLVAHQVPDERCRDASTYMIVSKFGNPCVVAAEISDADVRAHADFLIGLFSTKAAAAAVAP